jgi:hypothetical protein
MPPRLGHLHAGGVDPEAGPIGLDRSVQELTEADDPALPGNIPFFWAPCDNRHRATGPPGKYKANCERQQGVQADPQRDFSA